MIHDAEARCRGREQDFALTEIEWPGTTDVHLHCLSFAAHRAAVPQLLPWLSATELKRAAGFRIAELRERFVIAHAYTRAVLAHYLGSHPCFVPLGTNGHGKPCIATNHAVGAGLDFSLSHSDSLAVVAVASNAMVGVDVEQRRKRIDARAIAGRYFAPTEVKALDRLSAEDSDSLFVLLWACKEAFIKAIGLGLSYPLDRVVVCDAENGSPRYTAVAAEYGPADAWWLKTWRPATHSCIALAVKRPGPLKVRNFAAARGLRIVNSDRSPDGGQS